MRSATEGKQNLSTSKLSASDRQEESKFNQLWKINNEKAQKNGSHRTIYWVKHSKKYEDGSLKGEKWITSSKYIGDWEKNKKHGFGIQYYGNGDKYEGTWESNMRNGQGTLWVLDEKKKLRREYTGDWVNDKRTGRGTMFFKNDDRYDGYWLEDMPHGEGRMIYANGDIYEGMWSFGKKAGYGKLTRRNGDHFEGHWVNDKREGKGSYFYSSKNKVFVGEWVDDMPKAGVYSEVDDPDNPKVIKPIEFTDPYVLPEIPAIKLDNPAAVLETAVEDAKQARIFYRAAFIPRNELFTTEELNELEKEFKAAEATGLKETINITNLKAILQNLNFDQTEEEIKEMLVNIDEGFNPDEITFDLFCKLVAIYIELANSPALPKSDDIKEESTRKFEQEEDFGGESQDYE